MPDRIRIELRGPCCVDGKVIAIASKRAPERYALPIPDQKGNVLEFAPTGETTHDERGEILVYELVRPGGVKRG
jgi:hypothetical protein